MSTKADVCFGQRTATLVLVLALGCGADTANNQRVLDPQEHSAGGAGFGNPDSTSTAGAAGAPLEASTPENTGDCGMVKIEPMLTYSPGNLLVVFDRSMSMSTPFELGAAASRLDVARAAIKTALEPLLCRDVPTPDRVGCIDDISVALLTFPTHDGINGINPDPTFGIPSSLSCTVDELDSPEQMPWQGVTAFYDGFDVFWDTRTLNDGGPLYPGSYPLVFGTPISVAFERANRALMDPTVVGNKAVLFLTDGEETLGCLGGVDPTMQATEWQQMGIDTYVVSLAPPGLGQVFNDLVASNGGTEASVTPTDSESLTEEIARIVWKSSATTTCKVVIQNASFTDPASACELGDVYVSLQKVPCDQEERAEGFFVESSNTIQIVGSYCDQLEEDGRLEARFPCTVLGPI